MIINHLKKNEKKNYKHKLKFNHNYDYNQCLNYIEFLFFVF